MLACFSSTRFFLHGWGAAGMHIVDPGIDRYLHELARPHDPVLQEMEQLAERDSFPIVGPQVGRLLYLLAQMIDARRVIELGSGFGYSAYWFARAVGAEGRVVACEKSPQRAEQAADFLGRGGLGDRVEIVVGDALEIVGGRGGGFDVVFNDVDKESYPQVLDKAAAALRPGGLFISDNMLWFGNVLAEKPAEASTRGVKELTRLLYESDDFDTVLIPMRDGVTVSIYRS
jgi:predicted O-methyltransferase YrrM